MRALLLTVFFYQIVHDYYDIIIYVLLDLHKKKLFIRCKYVVSKEKVKTWLKLNKLSLNAQKAKVMVFHRKQKHVDEINVQINGTQIERVESFNFLGIMLDKNLTWKSHIEMVGKQSPR